MRSEVLALGYVADVTPADSLIAGFHSANIIQKLNFDTRKVKNMLTNLNFFMVSPDNRAEGGADRQRQAVA
jgi:hypothetical protein